MAKTKTAQTKISVDDFISKIGDEQKRDDSHALIKIYNGITGFPAAMWGASIIGFGSYHYKYDSGHEGDMALAGFSPRKTAIVFYVFSKATNHEALLKKLGKFKSTGGCIYVKKLEDIDAEVLKKLITSSVNYIKNLYP